MFKNIFYNTRKNEIHLWETIKGETFYDVIPWVPYVYEKSSKPTGIKSLQGDDVTRVNFSSFREYSEYQKETFDIFENKVPPAVQFLVERYYNIPDDEIETPNLKIYSLDIECISDRGFPDPKKATSPITLINIKMFGGESISWGIKEYNGKNEYDIQYNHYSSEIEMIRAFLNWWHRNAPDVVTGWNIVMDNKKNKLGGFDFPYIINRCKQLFGDETSEYRKLSPIGIVKIREDSQTGGMMINIAGVSLLDYMSLYKWYTPKNLPNHKLETVCQEELGVGKLDLSAWDNDHRRMFHEAWDTYVDYNAIDNIRVEDLENKLGYIKLAQSLSLLCKIPVNAYSAATQMMEGLMLTYYRRNNLCAPYFAGGEQEWFPAAFVKEPKLGLHKWVIDLDIASSYPTAIITLNMSNETYYGRILTREKATSMNLDISMTLTEAEVIQAVEKRNFDKPIKILSPNQGLIIFDGKKLQTFNKSLKKGLLTVAPCGSCFTTLKPGALADVERAVFMKRKETKKQMFEVRNKITKCKDEAEKQRLSDKAKNLFAFQWALKIVINGMFGVTGVPYSRYFNPHISEAITACGKNTILMGQKLANEILNNPSDELLSIIESLK